MPALSRLNLISCLILVCGALLSGSVHAEQVAHKPDFFGGYFEDGKYKCLREPCFKIHAAWQRKINTDPFRLKDWPHWADLDNNCQNEHEQMLAKTSLMPVVWEEGDKCGRVESGKWLIPYTGQEVDDINIMTMDHLISLFEAHDLGANRWPKTKRLEFSNTPMNLVPIDWPTKKLRNGRPSSMWMPPDQHYWCEYILQRERVARYFGLELMEADLIVGKEVKQQFCKY